VKQHLINVIAVWYDTFFVQRTIITGKQKALPKKTGP
jgi:hypothetical protein